MQTKTYVFITILAIFAIYFIFAPFKDSNQLNIYQKYAFRTKIRKKMMNTVGTQKWKLYLEDLFKKVVPKLNENNIYPIAFNGTLLGVVRDNQFICGDDDIDLMPEFSSYNKTLEVIQKLAKENKNILFFTSKGYGVFFPSYITIIDKYTKTNIDIEFFSVLKGYIYTHVNPLYRYFLYNRNPIKKDSFMPFLKMQFLDATIRIPNKAKKVLSKLYGKWQQGFLACEDAKKCSGCELKTNAKFTKKKT